jgi:hypothetical protein
MPDFKDYADTPSSPGRSWSVVTPNDAADLPGGVAKALWVVADGDLVAIAELDESAETVPVAAGMIVPVRIRRVMEATDATVVAVY